MRLTIKEKKSLLLKYKNNERRNFHRENNVMLIRLFGTKAEKLKATKLTVSHNRKGYLTGVEANWFYIHGHKKYFNKIKVK